MHSLVSTTTVRRAWVVGWLLLGATEWWGCRVGHRHVMCALFVVDTPVRLGEGRRRFFGAHMGAQPAMGSGER